MKPHATPTDDTYRDAMGRLLVLYTQVDRLIMEICAERIAHAPDEAAKLALAKQTGDESRHVSIQRQWIARFGTDPSAVISPAQEHRLRAHFRALPWTEYLADLYICVEALGSEAVQQVVPLADPGTRESLRVPLSDEADHVAFGLGRLRQELAALSSEARAAFLAKLPERIDAVTDAFEALGLDVAALFEAVGADFGAICDAVRARRAEILAHLALPEAA